MQFPGYLTLGGRVRGTAPAWWKENSQDGEGHLVPPQTAKTVTDFPTRGQLAFRQILFSPLKHFRERPSPVLIQRSPNWPPRLTLQKTFPTATDTF